MLRRGLCALDSKFKVALMHPTSLVWRNLWQFVIFNMYVCWVVCLF